MRIVFLTSELPYPPESGGVIKTLSLFHYLGARHDVRLLCFARAPLTAEQERWARQAGAETVPLLRARSAGNLLRSYVAGLPLSIERNRSREMQTLVDAALRREPPDAVFVDGWLMAQYLPPWYRGLRLLHQHNAEHVLWRRQAQLERNPLRRALVLREYARVRRYEAAILPRFDALFAVSDQDRAALIEIGADPGRLHLLPNVPDPELLERPELSFAEAGPVVLYFGTLSWQPNVEGLGYFLRDVWPLVRRRLPQASFLLAGRGSVPSLERLARRTPGVEFLGPVADAEPLYRRARVFIEATRTGGGTKLKVLNALARGLAVVATPQAAEGLEAVAGKHLAVASSPEEIAASVVRLLEDADLWASLSRAGRELVRGRYLAEVAFAALDEALARVPAGA